MVYLNDDLPAGGHKSVPCFAGKITKHRIIVTLPMRGNANCVDATGNPIAVTRCLAICISLEHEGGMNTTMAVLSRTLQNFTF